MTLTREPSAVYTRRLDLAGTRQFQLPGAGPARRAAISRFDREWLAEHFTAVTAARGVGGLALAAVGSVGRGDAGPLSDYDLVLLHHGRMRDGDLTRTADALWYPLWDSGVRLDHSVRTIAQCRAIASSDLSAAIGLLDIDIIAGDADLVAAARSTISHDWRAHARTRLPEVIDSLTARHRRHGDLSQSIEPELKEARGGLRDMTVLTALTRAWLADRPHGEVDTAYGQLLSVRDALHVVTGRGRDRLGREDHDAVAALLGFPDRDAMLTHVLSAGRVIAYALDGTVRRATQSQRARRLRVGPRRPVMTPLGYGVFVHDGEAVLGSPDLAGHWSMPLRAAATAARHGVPLAPATLARLAQAPAVPQPWPGLALDLLTELLGAGDGLPVVWEGLDQAGIIEQWLPEWSAVRSRPQHNPVHRHTVDRHLIETVVEAARLVRDSPRPDLLVLAALLHDIGKVPGARDHSAAGAAIVAGIAPRLGLSTADADLLTLLVREHLTLIDLATRRDHGDAATIAAAWSAVGEDPVTLELLAALSEADARAAGPTAWTPWRERLLTGLVAACRRAQQAGAPSTQVRDAPVPRADLAAGPVVTVSAEGALVAVRVEARDRLGLFADVAGVLAAARCSVRRADLATVTAPTGELVAVDDWVVEFEHGEPDAQALETTLRRVEAGDRSALQRLARRGRGGESGLPPRVFYVDGASASATVIEVRCQDRPGLLYDLGRALAGARVSVRSAHIATSAGQAMDTFYLVDSSGEPLAPAAVGQVVGVLMEVCERHM